MFWIKAVNLPDNIASPIDYRTTTRCGPDLKSFGSRTDSMDCELCGTGNTNMDDDSVTLKNYYLYCDKTEKAYHAKYKDMKMINNLVCCKYH